jgi:hypothetical protein
MESIYNKNEIDGKQPHTNAVRQWTSEDKQKPSSLKHLRIYDGSPYWLVHLTQNLAINCCISFVGTIIHTQSCIVAAWNMPEIYITNVHKPAMWKTEVWRMSFHQHSSCLWKRRCHWTATQRIQLNVQADWYTKQCSNYMFVPVGQCNNSTPRLSE